MAVTVPPSPIRYTPDVEQPEADEAETTQGIVAQMRKIGETVFKDSGHAERGVHARSHGLLSFRATANRTRIAEPTDLGAAP